MDDWLNGLDLKLENSFDDKVIKSQNRLEKRTMTDPKPIRTVRRGRIFPDIQWSEEKKARWKAEQEAFYQRCKVIFDRVQPEVNEICN